MLKPVKTQNYALLDDNYLLFPPVTMVAYLETDLQISQFLTKNHLKSHNALAFR